MRVADHCEQENRHFCTAFTSARYATELGIGFSAMARWLALCFGVSTTQGEGESGGQLSWIGSTRLCQMYSDHVDSDTTSLQLFFNSSHLHSSQISIICTVMPHLIRPD